MARIRGSTHIDASPKKVWAAIDDVATHGEWLSDATAIRFRDGRRAGVGTTFECDTKVGPLSLTDLMEITSWKPGREMGVRHVGVVRGSGRFSLSSSRGGTRFTWRERLTFPWWLGGSLGAVVGGEVLRLVWQRNLRNLKRLVETG